jgi:hypothetical protein
VTDLDNATLAAATVQIGAGFHAGQDVLAFTNDRATMGNITAAYDAAHGTLTLVSAGGTATLAQWQAALRSVTYTDTAVTPDTATRTIGFAVSDGTKTSVAITRDVTVATTDQTPTLSTTSSGPAAFVAGDNAASVPVTIDGGLTLSDLDNATLASATVQIGAGFHAGEDVLAFSNDGTMGNITASFDAAHGTLTLVSAGGTATLAQWQAALRSVTYTDTAVTPDATTRSIGFSINDGVRTSAAYSRDVSVAATDQTPLVGSTASGSTAFVSADNAVPAGHGGFGHHAVGPRQRDAGLGHRADRRGLPRRPGRARLRQRRRDDGQHHRRLRRRARHAHARLGGRHRHARAMAGRAALGHLHRHGRHARHGHAHHRLRGQRRRQDQRRLHARRDRRHHRPDADALHHQQRPGRVRGGDNAASFR